MSELTVGMYAVPLPALSAPRWILSTAQGACSICGFLTGYGQHYEHAEHNEVHCAACHRPGRDYVQAGDSEGSPVARRIQGVSCETCGKDGACFDTRGEQVVCRDCAMRHDDRELQR